MSNAAGTVQEILLQIADAMEPVEQALAPGQAQIALLELGIPLNPAQVSAVATPLANTVRNAHDMLQLASELTAAVDAGDDGAMISKGLGLAQKIVGLIESLDAVVTAVHGLGLAIPSATIDAIPERLVNLLLVDALEEARGVNEFLELLGILERQDFNAGSLDPNNPPFTISTFHFGRLSDWLQSPQNVLGQLYQWNQAGFTGVELLRKIGNLFAALGVPVHFDAAAVPPELDAVVLKITPTPTVGPQGISVGLLSHFNTGTITYGSDDWKIQFQLDFELPSSSAFTILPSGLTFAPPAPTGAFAGNAKLKFIADRTSATDGYLLLGDPGGSHLEVHKFEVDIGGGFTWDGTKANGVFSLGAAATGGKLAISFAETDGFIGAILGGIHLESDFDFGLGYSTDKGVYFTGSSSLIIQIPLHLDLGPVEISALTFSVGINGQVFPTFVAADIKASLGPLQVIVQEIGLEVDFALKDDRSGNAGPIDIDLGFKPPSGAGLSIDVGIVSGGGFLRYSPEEGEYSGTAELSLAGIVTVKAIGIITTKMPDGSRGFSLLIIISAEFTPIQLGFGFTLVGVGGLLGLNRAVLLDVLRDGVRTGAINSIMFPKDIIANAPRIISDLKAVFPPQNGVFLIGPMVKLGWGTPTLVSLSLGVIVEIPPGNIAILGILRAALPTEDIALINIQVNFVGILDFDKQMLSFDASLYDSHIIFLTLEGDMAVRVKWGDNAGFLLSVGGFHPAFHPPPLDLPTLARLKITILDYPFEQIWVKAYFAITSNTVQFGAQAHLQYGTDDFNVHGDIGFDVLFQFSPFYFNAMLSASLGIDVFGAGVMSIDLRMMLEGPNPWHAKGTGSISFLFFSIDVNLDVTWGESQNTSLPPVDVIPVFVGEINKPQNWKALPPPSSNLLVALRELDPSLMILHPFGALAISQRAIPLNLTLDKFGNQAPDDANKVNIKSAVTGPTTYPLGVVNESFAAAQFLQLSDAEKLSRPSYQQLQGGVTIGTAGGPQTSKMTRRTIEYQQTIIDKEPESARFKVRAITALFHAYLSGAAQAKSTLSFQTKSQLKPYPDKISVGAASYAVASTANNKLVDVTLVFTSEAMAVDAMKSRVAADPSLTDAIHVLPAHEVTKA